MKKTLIISACVLVSMIGYAAADELQSAYEYAYGIGITTKSNIEEADMQGSLIRSHMAKMMTNYAIQVLGQTPDTSKNCNFSDIAEESTELRGYIIKACQLGIMGVNLSKFSPNDIVTRAQFGTTLSRALYGGMYNTGDPYYVDHLQALKNAGIMSQINTPQSSEIRGYVMLMMMRAANTIPDDQPTTTTCDDEEVQMLCAVDSSDCPSECQNNTSSAGILTVTKDVRDVQGELPSNTKYVGSLQLSAADSDISLNTLTFTKIGSFLNGWIEDDGITISSFTTPTSATKITTILPKTTLIKAGTSKILDIFIESSSTSAQGVSLAAGKDMNTSAISIKGGFPYTLTSTK